jgi:fructokinase
MMPDLICLGELLIDFCSTAVDRPLAQAPGFTKAPGGAPANVAVAAARLGGSTGFIGAVGADPFGEFLAGVLAAEGVDTTGLARVTVLKTPLAFVAVNSSGQSDFFFYHDAGLAPLRPEFIDDSYVRSAQALHFGSISRIEESARAATDQARRAAASAGLLVSYDPNYRPRLWPDATAARARIREGFAGATVAKVSQEEWAFILETDDFDRGARQLFDMGVKLVIRSEGPAGARFATPTAAGSAGGFRVQSVEFTGAGDAFLGSVLVSLLQFRRAGVKPEDIPLPDLTRIFIRANAVGALTTTKPGAIPALPFAKDVDVFLASQSG